MGIIQIRLFGPMSDFAPGNSAVPVCSPVAHLTQMERNLPKTLIICRSSRRDGLNIAAFSPFHMFEHGKESVDHEAILVLSHERLVGSG